MHQGGEKILASLTVSAQPVCTLSLHFVPFSIDILFILELWGRVGERVYDQDQLLASMPIVENPTR